VKGEIQILAGIRYDLPSGPHHRVDGFQFEKWERIENGEMLITYNVEDHMGLIRHKFMQNLLDFLILKDLNGSSLACLLEDGHDLIW
jgi:hypothetical protein